jgi:hypothetical protein
VTEISHSSRIGKTLSDTALSLRVALVALYRLTPGIVVVGAILSVMLVWLTIQWTALMTGTAVLLILLLSLTIFALRGNFGEGLLSLVGGLLSIFAYEWTPQRYIAFSIAWIGFTLFALIIVSIKLASKSEDLLKQAAIRIVGPSVPSSELQKVESLLSEISRQTSQSTPLGPTERSNLILTFAFRGLDLKLFTGAMSAAECLRVITKSDLKQIAVFVVDFFQILHPQNNADATSLTNLLCSFVQSTPVPPDEFFDAFENSRRLLLSKVIEPGKFLTELRNHLSSGVPVDQIYHEIQLNCSKEK